MKSAWTHAPEFVEGAVRALDPVHRMQFAKFTTTVRSAVALQDSQEILSVNASKNLKLEFQLTRAILHRADHSASVVIFRDRQPAPVFLATSVDLHLVDLNVSCHPTAQVTRRVLMKSALTPVSEPVVTQPNVELRITFLNATAHHH